MELYELSINKEVWKELVAKYESTCSRCFARIHVGEEIDFNKATRAVRHSMCYAPNIKVRGGSHSV